MNEYRIVKIDSRDFGNRHIAAMYDHVHIIEELVLKRVWWTPWVTKLTWVKVGDAISLSVAEQNLQRIKSRPRKHSKPKVMR